MFSITWTILQESAIFILVGFAVAGLLDGLLPRDRSFRFLSENRLRSVFLAALIGAPLPLCSCSVLPAAVTLRKRGASKAATLSFLISTPETSATSVLLTYSLLGPLMAVIRPIASCVTAVVAGLVEAIVESRSPSANASDLVDETPKTCCSSETAGTSQCYHSTDAPVEYRSVVSRLRAGMRYAFVDLFDDIFGWIVLGIVAAGVIQAWLPPEVLDRILGGPLQSMLLMLLIGVPLYVCAESSTPVAAALIAQGVNPGAALVLLLVGPATNLGSLGILYKMLGRRTIIIYLASIVLVALAAGAVLNLLLDGSNIAFSTRALCEPFVPEWLKTTGAVVFLAIGAASVRRSRQAQRLIGRFAGR